MLSMIYPKICFWNFLIFYNLIGYLIHWYFSRIWRAEVEVNSEETLTVPADCTKGRIQWNLPSPSTDLDVQFQSQNPSYCFVSNYLERFANYAVIEDDVSTVPYRGNLFYRFEKTTQLILEFQKSKNTNY